MTFSDTAARLPATVEKVAVGCPVNPRILTGDRVEAAARYGLDPDKRTLLVVGGSLGSAALNRLAIETARHPGRTAQVLHVCGPKYLDEVRTAYATVPPGVHIVGYEDRMGDAYAVADLVVARSGSSTLAELCALGKPSLLVPSPNVTDNHQEGNARGLERAGAARVRVEPGMDVDAAAAEIHALLGDDAALDKMAIAARGLGRADVAERVADLIETRFPAP